MAHGKIERGIDNRIYWVFESEDDAMGVFWIVKILRFFGLKMHASCFGGFYNAWMLF